MEIGEERCEMVRFNEVGAADIGPGDSVHVERGDQEGGCRVYGPITMFKSVGVGLQDVCN